MAVCKLCGKERNEYKFGCCKTCYLFNVKKVYKLKEDVRFHINSQERMIREFLENQNVSKQYLADKYCISIQAVYLALRQYCDVLYVRKDKPEFIVYSNYN